MFHSILRNKRMNLHQCLYTENLLQVDIAIHEMLHAAGTMHEQSRVADRDKLITYNWGPISSGWEFNYQGFVLSNARQYDLGSVLQYGLWVRYEIIPL